MLTGLFHPALHPLFETLGYAAGYAAYKHARATHGDVLPDDRRWLIIAAAATGALVGSRALGLLEQVPQIHMCWQLVFAPGGKTIVGGLLGGWLAVEIVKRVRGIRSRTGDLFALPLCVGIAVGRVGCFLAGLSDDTYGKPTSVPWGVNFGDAIPRHPTQLYEIVFLGLLSVTLWLAEQRPHQQGILFRTFMAAYLFWRLLIDFIKPQPLVHGLTMIQWACVVGLITLVLGELGRAQEVVDV